MSPQDEEKSGSVSRGVTIPPACVRSYDATEVLGSVKGARSGPRGSIDRQTNAEAAANAYSLNFVGSEEQQSNMDADVVVLHSWLAHSEVRVRARPSRSHTRPRGAPHASGPISVRISTLARPPRAAADDDNPIVDYSSMDPIQRFEAENDGAKVFEKLVE